MSLYRRQEAGYWVWDCKRQIAILIHSVKTQIYKMNLKLKLTWNVDKGSVTYRFCPQETSMDVGGGGGGACDVSRWKIVENFDSWKFVIFWNHLYMQSIQNPTFSLMYLYFEYICMLIIRSWLSPKCTFKFYSHHSVLNLALQEK